MSANLVFGIEVNPWGENSVVVFKDNLYRKTFEATNRQICELFRLLFERGRLISAEPTLTSEGIVFNFTFIVNPKKEA